MFAPKTDFNGIEWRIGIDTARSMIKMNKHYHVHNCLFNAFGFVCVCGHHVLDIILLVFSFFWRFPFSTFVTKQIRLAFILKKKSHIVKMQLGKRTERRKITTKNGIRAYIQCIFIQQAHAITLENEEQNAMRVKGKIDWWKRNTRTHARTHTHTHPHHTSWCEFNTNISINRICKPVKYIRNLWNSCCYLQQHNAIRKNEMWISYRWAWLSFFSYTQFHVINEFSRSTHTYKHSLFYSLFICLDGWLVFYSSTLFPWSSRNSRQNIHTYSFCRTDTNKFHHRTWSEHSHRCTNDEII